MPPRNCPLSTAYRLLLSASCLLFLGLPILSSLFLPNFLPVGKNRTNRSSNFLRVGNEVASLADEVTKRQDGQPLCVRLGGWRLLACGSLRCPHSGGIGAADIEWHVSASQREARL